MGSTAHSRSTRAGMLAWAALSVAACLEPNPYLAEQQAGSGTTTGASSGRGDATGPGTPTGSGGMTGGGSSGDSGAGSTAAPASCADLGWQCVDVAPSGWLGPFAHWEGDAEEELFTCPAPFDTVVSEGFDDVVAPASTCGCTCGALSGASCSGGSVGYHNISGCGGPPPLPVSLFDGCNEPATGPWPISGSFSFNAPTVVGGVCSPQPTKVIIPPRFAERHAGCSVAPDPRDCGADRSCIPMAGDPYHANLCIARSGDVECPPGPYSERLLLFRDIEDDRDCQPCICEPPTGECTGASLQLLDDYDCRGDSAGVVPPGGCTNGVGTQSVRSLLYDEGSLPADECDAGTPSPTGQGIGIDPVTFCCAML